VEGKRKKINGARSLAEKNRPIAHEFSVRP